MCGCVSHVSRRDTLKMIALAGATASACSKTATREATDEPLPPAPGASIVSVSELGFPWRTPDPFLACMHHDDTYPAGNERFGPDASLAGRNLGRDFDGKDGWRMYHGRVVPGFPQHPHRGFETVTVVRRGLLDHSDSLGASARYGRGDVQWLTAGRGILHAEMFPLIERRENNPLELFQIWLNLPSVDKMVAPHFTMLWSDDIPRHVARDAQGRTTEVTIIAGTLGDLRAAPPPPKSWAAQAANDVAIWTIALAPHAEWTLPGAAHGTNRTLYFHAGKSLRIAGRDIPDNHAIEVVGDRALSIVNGAAPSELLMLQGRPIGEPVARSGPFVMNTDAEIRAAYADFRATSFGGWPWGDSDPVHGSEDARFARFSDGRIERPA